MKPSLRYRAYQLLIDSDLVLPELLEAAGHDQVEQADVRIRLGDAGQGADGGRRQIGPYAWCAANELWLDVPKVGRFLATQGNKIMVEVHRGADEDSVRLFLLGSVFGALLTQRGLLVLHGNAIRVGDQCLVCVGSSGVGKSTLAAGFLKRGHTILADDVVPVDELGRALPGFPRVKLWRDSANHLEVDIDNLCRLRPGLDKFNYPLGSMFESQPLPIRWIYSLDRASVEQAQFLPMSGMQSFMPLFHNTYRLRFLQGMGGRTDHLRLCGQLAGKTHVVRVQRPNTGFDLDGLIDAMLADAQHRG